MNVHQFGDTGQAYDACQCCDFIKDGDLLVIESERVVGVADTWPFAVTKACGKLHEVLPNTTDEELAIAAGIPVENIKLARAYVEAFFPGA